MARTEPNPFRDIGPWCEVLIGGNLIKASLTKINGVSTKDEWKKQKSKESSGSTKVFAGTTVGDPKLTFTAVDEDEFDDLRDFWDLLAPKPGQGGTGAPAAPTGGTQYTAAAQPRGEAVGSPPAASASTDTTSSADASSSSSSSSASKDNPGPRPPTVSIQNEILRWHGITSIARGEWEGPTPTETRGWEVVLTVVPQDPPKPAGAGAMAPAKPGDKFSGGVPTPQDGMSKDATAGAAGV
jgi:hypothetical protein